MADSQEETGSPVDGLTLLELATTSEIMGELERRRVPTIVAICSPDGSRGQVHIQGDVPWVIMFGLAESVKLMVHRRFDDAVSELEDDDSD